MPGHAFCGRLRGPPEIHPGNAGVACPFAVPARGPQGLRPRVQRPFACALSNCKTSPRRPAPFRSPLRRKMTGHAKNTRQRLRLPRAHADRQARSGLSAPMPYFRGALQSDEPAPSPAPLIISGHPSNWMAHMDRRSAIRAGHPDLGRAPRLISAPVGRGSKVHAFERSNAQLRQRPPKPFPVQAFGLDIKQLAYAADQASSPNPQSAFRLDASGARRYERLDVRKAVICRC
jgi:hypothetical protein